MDRKYILIAGHYDFREQPTTFAINSLKKIRDIQNVVGVENTILYTFINDMRYDNLCGYGLCNTRIRESKVPTESPQSVDNSFITELKKILHQNGVKDFSSFFVTNYHRFISRCDLYHPSVINLLDRCTAILNNSISQNQHDFCQCYDDFMYSFDKNGFVPYKYEFELGIQCKTLYEKNVFNTTSKLLKKLKKQNCSGLVCTIEGNRVKYECDGFENNKILLRIEDSTNRFSATNKCPSIIANLYYRLLKDCQLEKCNFSIVYIVPSYDRNKIYLGTQAFYSLLYPYLLSKNEVVGDVQITNISWANEEGTYSITDKFTEYNCIHHYNSKLI